MERKIAIATTALIVLAVVGAIFFFAAKDGDPATDANANAVNVLIQNGGIELVNGKFALSLRPFGTDATVTQNGDTFEITSGEDRATFTFEQQVIRYVVDLSSKDAVFNLGESLTTFHDGRFTPVEKELLRYDNDWNWLRQNGDLPVVIQSVTSGVQTKIDSGSLTFRPLEAMLCETVPKKSRVEGTIAFGDSRGVVPVIPRFGRTTAIVTMIDAPPKTVDRDAQLAAITQGHSNPNDPRYGNGGLGAMEIEATVIGKKKKLNNVYRLTDCPKKKATYVSNAPISRRVQAEHSFWLIGGSEKSLSGFDSASLVAAKNTPSTWFWNIELAGSPDPMRASKYIIADGRYWTLSPQFAKSLANQELASEDPTFDFQSVEQYVKRLEALRSIRIRPHDNSLVISGIPESPTFVFEGTDPIDVAGAESSVDSKQGVTRVWWANTDDQKTIATDVNAKTIAWTFN